MNFLKNKKTKATSMVVFFVAAGLITYGAWGLMERRQATNNPNPVIPTTTVTHSTDKPDETPPLCDDSYQVPANEPRKIELPDIGVSGCVQKVGIDQNNAVAVPTNIHVAGWYTNSVTPGHKGISIIDGHVSGRYSDAIFTNLGRAIAGDTVKVQFGDHTWKHFIVVDTQSYTVNEATKEMFKPLEDMDNQLTLITCSGSYDKASQTYDQRTLVRARLAQ